MKIDLHTHSSCSDGTDTPSELVRKAADVGLDVLAITDHDTTVGWEVAEKTAEAIGIRLVRGIELSTDNQRQAQHLLAYELDPTYPELVERLESGAKSRRERVPRTLDLLRKQGIDLSEDDVRKATGSGTTGRPHIADAMVAARRVKDRAEAFELYLADGLPAYVPREKLSIEDAIALVKAAGGVSVVAHPRGRGSVFPQERFAELQALGLSGIEVDHEEHDEVTRAELRAIATELGLVVTGSSDYHGDGKKGHPLGCNTTRPDALDRLLGDRQ